MMMEKREKSSGNGYGESSPCPMMIGQMRGDHQDQPAAAAGNDSSSSSSSSSMMIVNTSMRTAETLLRLIPIAPCIAALVVMLHNSQTNDFGSVSYSHLGAFRYLVHVNGICAGYSLLSAAIAAMPRPPKMSQAWTFFVLDQLMTYLVLAAGAVSTEVLYLSFKGDAAITWSSACSSFDTFCHKATASVGTTFVVVVCYAVLSLISSYKLFSNYDAPVLANYPTKASIEVTTFHG